jgi:hypothetical protein
MDETYRPTIHTQADLQDVWRELMGPWGFGGRSIWMLRFDTDRQLLPVITEIKECEGLPDPEMSTGLGEILRTLDEDDPGTTFAFLLSRPGHGVDDTDRAWARLLLDVGRAAGVHLEMPHLATEEGVRPLPPDELAPRLTA